MSATRLVNTENDESPRDSLHPESAVTAQNISLALARSNQDDEPPRRLSYESRRRLSQDEDESIYDGHSNSHIITVPSTILSKMKIKQLDRRTLQNTYRQIVKDILTPPAGFDESVQSAEISQYPAENKYKGLLFDDGRSSIDFVLVYEVKRGCEGKNELEKCRAHARKRFLIQLLKAGIEMENAYQLTASKYINYIKLHLPFAILCAYAEHLSFRVPLQELDEAGAQQRRDSANMWLDDLYKQKLRLSNPHTQQVPLKPDKFYTCTFKIEKLNKFLGGSDEKKEEKFFGQTQKSLATYHILKTTAYGKRSKGEVGINPLIDDSVFTAAYPLHDADTVAYAEDVDPKANMRMRPILSRYWANYSVWYKLQPLDHIRAYFGETVSIYFAWLGYYTAFLIPAALVGVIVFAYGVITMHNNPVANEVCESGTKYLLCPQCEECLHTFISESCVFVRYGYWFDHPGTVIYSVFISFWAVFFLQFWRRHRARLAFDWDCTDYHDWDEKPRPEYMNMAPERKKNPITGEEEPYFPRAKQRRRKCASLSFILFMVLIVVMFILACIIYKVLISIYLARIPLDIDNKRDITKLMASGSGTLINLILILIMGRIYQLIAQRLTQWEMHRTQSEYDDSYSTKVFVFQFVNFYSSIFYVAFAKGKFIGYPGHYHRVLGLRNEDCTQGGCMIELALQLMIIMVGIQIVNNLQEIILPLLQKWWQNKESVQLLVEKDTVKQRWEADYELLPNEGLFNEYLEMTLQFGFITIFVAACPLAPLFALINNWVEIRLDAGKFINSFRRPIVGRAQDIGVWSYILHLIVHIAVVSNAFIISFTSEFIPRLYYKFAVREDMVGFTNFTLSVSNFNNDTCLYKGHRDERGNYTKTHWQMLTMRLLFVVVFEHFVFGVQNLIDFIIPDVPRSLDITIKREQYLAKQALAANAAALLVAKQQLDDEDDEGTKTRSSENIEM